MRRGQVLGFALAGLDSLAATYLRYGAESGGREREKAEGQKDGWFTNKVLFLFKYGMFAFGVGERFLSYLLVLCFCSRAS